MKKNIFGDFKKKFFLQNKLKIRKNIFLIKFQINIL